MVKQLLSASADCDIATQDGLTPLHSAVVKGQLQVAGIDAQTSCYMTMPVHLNNLTDDFRHVLNRMMPCGFM